MLQHVLSLRHSSIFNVERAVLYYMIVSNYRLVYHDLYISCRESIKVIMSFDLTSRNKDYKSLEKRWVMGLMGQMSFIVV